MEPSVTRSDWMVLKNEIHDLSSQITALPKEENISELRRDMAALSEGLVRVTTLVSMEESTCPYRELLARASNNIVRMDNVEKLLPELATKKDLAGIKSDVSWLVRGSGALIALGGVAALIANIAGLW